MTKKEKILTTALNLFIEKGFEKTPTSRISAEAGVATGTLFHHFKNKEELINTLYVEIKTDMLASLANGIEQEVGLRSKFQQIWGKFLSWVLEHPKKYQFLMQFSESQFITQSTKQTIEELSQGIHALLEQGQKEGICRDLPLELLLTITHSLFTAASRYFLENPTDFEDQKLVDSTFDAFWAALSKD